jgi:folate-binding protein YgfZ
MPEAATDGAATLREALATAGAIFGDDGSVLSFGDAGQEYESVRSTGGVAVSTGGSMLTVDGADRVRFVQGLVTCDVRDDATGGDVYGYFTSPQGKVLADAVWLVGEERLDAIVPAAVAGDLVEHLRRYVVMDRVEIRLRSGWSSLIVLGSEAGERLVRAGLDLSRHDEATSHGDVTWRQVPLRWATDRRRGVPAWSLWTARERLPELFQNLIGQVGLSPVGEQAMEIVRVEEGIPAFGKEFDQEALPQEIGEEAAVSYTKGCYLGQEVVARIHYRGKVNRTLRGVLLSGPPVDVGAELLAADEERVVGRMGGNVDSPRAAGVIGLALLHRRGGEPGDRLRLASGETAEVMALPFHFDS